MRIFLAGGISGNLREFWQKVMKVYCASPNSRKEVIEAMNSFLAGDKDKIMRESIYGAPLKRCNSLRNWAVAFFIEGEVTKRQRFSFPLLALVITTSNNCCKGS